MSLFQVYAKYPVHLTKGKGTEVWDEAGNKYLDMYGGHGVISIGHSHPVFVEAVKEQVSKLCFYSNAVELGIQEKYAEKLQEVSGLTNYQLFLCNSGAEANENALKVASFETGRKKVLAFHKSFHGRTEGAVRVTDNPALRAPYNEIGDDVCFIGLNDEEKLVNALQSKEYAAVIIEGIQGVGGLHEASTSFFQLLEKQCKATGTLLILDEVQSGFGRTGDFFAFQHHGIQPDIVSIAKGMGNGFPIGGILVQPNIKVKQGMLGTTFGGNPLACAAGLAVLNVLESEKLLSNVVMQSEVLKSKLGELDGVKSIKGRGLMLGLETELPASELRNSLLSKFKILTGGSANPNQLRILPALSLNAKEVDEFVNAIKLCYEEVVVCA